MTSEESHEEDIDIEHLEDAIIQSMGQNIEETIDTVSLPSQLPIFPLTKRPFFPGMATPIVVEKGTYYEILKQVAKSKKQFIGLVLTKSETQEIGDISLKDLYQVGVVARILRIIPIEGGGAQVILNMEKRISLKKASHEGDYIKAHVAYHEDIKTLTKELKAYSISIISTIKELLKLNPLFKEELQIFLSHSDFTEPGKLADFACALTTASREELQEVLATFDLEKRIERALSILKKELDLGILQNSINQKIEATMTRSQRELFLREQLKTIKRELGLEKDDKAIDREKFEGRMKDREIPDDVKSVIDEELDKLSVMEPQSAEYAVSRNYLDWLTVLPWGIKSPDRQDLNEAKDILETDHYGLSDIKTRILEFIAVGKLTGGLKGSILCLAGPPGVGKTSVGKSIARALDRQFYRFSVGGMRDEAEIKGHRRTYIGAMPGKLIQALKLCQTMNPVIMIDEVDKMGSSYQGDPGSALLEVLDPEQNQEFLDHYLDVRSNLSDVLFIVTANVLDTIPEPLKDRMDILRLSGYIMQEKVEIAKKYLIPRNRKKCGLKASQVVFSPEAIRLIINGYAREAGVRNLENLIKKILRKVAVKIVEEEEIPAHKKGPVTTRKSPVRITEKNLQIYLGKPIFLTERLYPQTPLGVCTGLAWTAMGGATLYIETIKMPSDKREMRLTGQAGDVMKESSYIAWSYLQTSMAKYAPNLSFFEKEQVHIHIPEGATPKDGPSAGITMVTALLSLLLGHPVKKDLAMTGELTLTGQILPVGGVKEKIVAARRAELKEVILPKENKRDFDELPDYVKKGLKIHYVSHYDEVFPLAFPPRKKKGATHDNQDPAKEPMVRRLQKKTRSPRRVVRA